VSAEPLQVTVGHVTVRPQLVVAVPPQRLTQASPLYVQPQALALPAPSHVCGGWHVSGHVMAWPQLLVAGPQARPAHAVVLSGVQHVPLEVHTSAFGQVLEQLTV
jgi:hypothetical protein